MTSKPWNWIAAGVLACAALWTRPALAQEDDYYDYYEYYEYGYDQDYADDWFYDYYAYDEGVYDGEYDYYTDYDYDADVFDWEEDGLFE